MFLVLSFILYYFLRKEKTDNNYFYCFITLLLFMIIELGLYLLIFLF